MNGRNVWQATVQYWGNGTSQLSKLCALVSTWILYCHHLLFLVLMIRILAFPKRSLNQLKVNTIELVPFSILCWGVSVSSPTCSGCILTLFCTGLHVRSAEQSETLKCLLCHLTLKIDFSRSLVNESKRTQIQFVEVCFPLLRDVICVVWSSEMALDSMKWFCLWKCLIMIYFLLWE